MREARFTLGSGYDSGMAMLALATSGPTGEVGLRLDDGHLRTARIAGRTRGRELVPAIHTLLNEAGIAPAALRSIAVDIGPGSFTGVRVGVTTAKTLAFALGIPTLPYMSLAILAHGADHDGPVVALRDAGRGGAYFAAYGPRGEAGTRPVVHGATRGTPAEVVSVCEGALLVGEDAEALTATLGIPGEARNLRADAQALIALADAAPVACPAHDLAPAYLQASAPERLRAGETPGPAN